MQSKCQYRFGGKLYHGLGNVDIRPPKLKDHYVEFSAELVVCHVPLLLGLDQFTAIKGIMDFNEDFIISKSGGWKLLLIPKMGYAYVELCADVLYSKS